jgi:hypothetical protein
LEGFEGFGDNDDDLGRFLRFDSLTRLDVEEMLWILSVEVILG